MKAEEILEIVSRTNLEKGIEILATEIDELKETLEVLEEKQKELMDEAGDGFVTALGRRISKRTRTNNKIDVEMFFLTDKDKYLEFAESGKLTVPASCIKELDIDSPYITQNVTEFYILRGDKVD